MAASLFFLFALLFPFYSYAADLSVHGYLRNRVVFYQDLDTQKPNASVNQGGLGDNDRFGPMLFNQMRLRIEPNLKVNDNLSIHTQFDILDNVISGTEETKQIDFLSPIIGTIQLPGAGGAFGVVGGEAGENKALNVRRVFMDILTPGGKFRLGRQPSHWGLGMFQNDGNGSNDDFGDTADRILYLASLETPKFGTFNFGASADVAFTQQTDPRVSGLGGAITSPKEDMRQFAGLFLYEFDAFQIGTFSGIRYRNGREGTTTTTARQILIDANGAPILDSNLNYQLTDPVAAGRDGDTLTYFTDIYLEFEKGPFRLRGEYGILAGKLSTGLAIDAIPFNNLPAGALGAIELPAQNTMLVQMAAAELEGDLGFGDFLFQGGYASGDRTPLSSQIKQFGFRPDYQIAMLLFHAPLGSSPALTQANGNGSGSRLLVGAVPVTGNFINNAVYGALGYWHHIDLSPLVPKVGPAKAGVKVITAWAAQNTFDIDFAEMTNFTALPRVVNTNKWYGLEIDGNFNARFFEHIVFDLTAGYLMPGDAYDVKVDTINPTNAAQINTIPFDAANWVLGARGMVTAEF